MKERKLKKEKIYHNKTISDQGHKMKKLQKILNKFMTGVKPISVEGSQNLSLLKESDDGHRTLDWEQFSNTFEKAGSSKKGGGKRGSKTGKSGVSGTSVGEGQDKVFPRVRKQTAQVIKKIKGGSVQDLDSLLMGSAKPSKKKR